ncbi:MAG TPA: SMP-30/gluconolactonase/LRE family protein, partial [Polyangiaceae bacterium]|nr:SMP-30/gluconolactonase/LRE family protein [Polyangiaceae bacterium]
ADYGGAMRLREIGLSVLAGGLLACSSDSKDDPEGALGPGGASAAGAGGAAGAAGSGGSSATTPNAGAGSSGASGSGSSMEGVDVSGPLDTGNGGSSSAGEAGGSGGAGAGDAGAAPSDVASVCPPGPFAASPLPAGATPQAVCTGMTFTEGAVWVDRLQTLFFSDFAIGDAASNFNGPIMAYTPGGECEEFIADAGTNGLAIAPDGNLLGARHSTQTLTLFDLGTKQSSVFVADNGGLAFNSPNDIAVRSDGNIYFTDPNYMLGNRTSEQPTRAYRRDPSGAISVIDAGANPNGITLSPDESRLYLSHLGGGRNDVVVFDVDPSGALGEPAPFVNVGSDGMAIDCAGNLYITQGGQVRVFSPDGEPLGQLAAPGAANVAFGGPERRTLFITATGTLFQVELAIPGLPY